MGNCLSQGCHTITETDINEHDHEDTPKEQSQSIQTSEIQEPTKNIELTPIKENKTEPSASPHHAPLLSKRQIDKKRFIEKVNNACTNYTDDLEGIAELCGVSEEKEMLSIIHRLLEKMTWDQVIVEIDRKEFLDSQTPEIREKLNHFIFEFIVISDKLLTYKLIHDSHSLLLSLSHSDQNASAPSEPTPIKPVSELNTNTPLSSSTPNLPSVTLDSERLRSSSLMFASVAPVVSVEEDSIAQSPSSVAHSVSTTSLTLSQVSPRSSSQIKPPTQTESTCSPSESGTDSVPPTEGKRTLSPLPLNQYDIEAHNLRLIRLILGCVSIYKQKYPEQYRAFQLKIKQEHEKRDKAKNRWKIIVNMQTVAHNLSTEEVHPIDVNDLDHEIETYELPVVDFEKTLGVSEKAREQLLFYQQQSVWEEALIDIRREEKWFSVIREGNKEDIHILEELIYSDPNRWYQQWDPRRLINSVDNHHRTALYLSASLGYKEFVQFLLQNGANPQIMAITGENDELESPAESAARWGYISILPLLIEPQYLTKQIKEGLKRIAKKTNNKEIKQIIKSIPDS